MSLMIVLAQSILLFSQPIFFNDSQNSSCALEIQKPKFEGEGASGYGFFLNFQGRLSDRAKFLFELPYFHYSENYHDQYYSNNYSSGSIGNILIGIKTGPPEGGAYFEGGLRLPTSNEGEGGALMAGSISDITRMEGFIPNSIIVKAALGYQNPKQHGLTGRFKIGPSFWIYSGGASGFSSNILELIFNYYADAWYRSEKVNFGGGWPVAQY